MIEDGLRWCHVIRPYGDGRSIKLLLIIMPDRPREPDSKELDRPSWVIAQDSGWVPKIADMDRLHVRLVDKGKW